ncbi:unnamed protein product [Penicillium glandicola]
MPPKAARLNPDALSSSSETQLRSRPKLLKQSLHLTTLWCLQCFRTSLRDWDSGMPFEPNCWIDTAAPKLCRRCSTTHGKCDSLPRGIRGHGFELMALLEFAKQFWANDEGGFGRVDGADFLWTNEVIEDMSHAINDLCTAFDNLVKTHGKAHMLTGNPSDASHAQYVLYGEAKTVYSAWCNAREHMISSNSTYTSDLPRKYASRATEHLRLRVGEEAYTHWAVAICAFHNASKSAFEDDQENDQESDLTSFDEVFPLELPEL